MGGWSARVHSPCTTQGLTMQRCSIAVMVFTTTLLVGGCMATDNSASSPTPAAPSAIPQGTFTDAQGSAQTLSPAAFAAMQYSGQGSYHWPDGQHYQGHWHQGARHGEGQWRSADGLQYQGHWQADRYHGQGILLTPEGERYEGQFTAGQRKGEGELTNDDGRYQGAWHNDQPQGQGRFEGVDGSVYIGAYQAGDRHGSGRFTSAGGSVYEGDWLADEPSGFGVLVEANGGRREGQWLDGTSSGYGTYQHPAGLHYEGHWEADQRAGFGAEQRPDGSHYEGHWNADKPEGEGTLTLATGRSHHGLWQSGLPHGVGTVEDPAGYELTGRWNNGTLTSGTLTLQDVTTNNQFGPQALINEQGLWQSDVAVWLRNHAEAGSAAAAWLLIARNSADSAGLLETAAEADIALAQYELGKRLLDADLHRAIHWLNKASNGNPHAGGAAHFLLGSLYHFGELLPQDQDQAESHYLVAIKRGNIPARRNLAAMLATTSIDYLRDPERALDIIEPIALLYQSPGLLDALAVVYLANDRAGDAVQTQQSALAALNLKATDNRADHPELSNQIKAEMEQRLLRYQIAAGTKP